SLKAVENAIRSQKPNPVVSVSDEQGNSKEIVTSLKAVENAIRSQKPNPVVSAITKVVSGTAGSVLRGSMENLGKQSTEKLVTGIIDSIEKSIGNTIGSTTLLGGKLGDVLTSSISKMFSDNIDKGVAENISKE
ncbi:MAG: hypothetical protein ACKPER_23505, partial [Dolichospermum sp.]